MWGSVINDQTAALRIHQASGWGNGRVDTILGYSLYYPWSLSNASRRHRTREGTPRVHQTRGHAPYGERDSARYSPADALRVQGLGRDRTGWSRTLPALYCTAPLQPGSRSRRDSNSACSTLPDLGARPPRSDDAG